MKLSKQKKVDQNNTTFNPEIDMDNSYGFCLEIYIVPSLHEENLIFVFNGVTERKLYLDSNGICSNHYDFNTDEKRMLRSYGIKICN